MRLKTWGEDGKGTVVTHHGMGKGIPWRLWLAIAGMIARHKLFRVSPNSALNILQRLYAPAKICRIDTDFCIQLKVHIALQMAIRTSLRPLAPLNASTRFANALTLKSVARPRLTRAQFHTSRTAFLGVGEKYASATNTQSHSPRLPQSTLMEKNASDRVDLQ